MPPFIANFEKSSGGCRELQLCKATLVLLPKQVIDRSPSLMAPTLPCLRRDVSQLR